MNREEFLSQLERLLYDIPAQEREEALEYYNGYFDDAGKEKEAEVIQELGSPGKVAAIIKADLSGNEADYEEYTEQGYQDVRFDKKDMLKETNHYHQEESRYGQHTQKKRSGLTWGLVIVLVILTSPIWAGGGLGILGILFGLIVGVLGIIAAIGIGGAALLIAGITAIQTKVSLTPSAKAEGYIEEGYAFSPMFKLGYKKQIKDKEVFATWLNLEKAN